MMSKTRTDQPLEEEHESPALSRRDFVRTSALGGLALAFDPVLGWAGGGKTPSSITGPAKHTLQLNGGWMFGGRLHATGERKFTSVHLPHCVAPLSWQNWDPASWEDLWLYRRDLPLPKAFRAQRIFLHFSGVMVGATPIINGHRLQQHLGGYLPFEYEITPWVKDSNTLEVEVDSRWSNVPPEGSPVGPKRVDYLEAGGIYRSVRLEAVPNIFIRDVFAKPIQVLDPGRRVEITCTLDAAVLPSRQVRVETELRDGSRVISRAGEDVGIESVGKTQARLTLSNLRDIDLWDVDKPRLYDIVTTLFVDGKAIHDHRVRTGLRDARFELDGFFLNGRRLQLFGLNRHEIYPYVGGAMPPRVMHRDAGMLRHEFNCNIVRCSHYPQSEAFLDACDEFGLMAWEEVPGWGYIGDDAWKDLLVRNVHDMVVRDRNHPSIVIWGVRANESPNDVELYRRTTEVAKSLDDSRPASGSMTSGTRKDWQEHWHEDVFAYDDYHAAPDGSVGIADPVPGVPYMLAEAVGQFNYFERKGFNSFYRRAGDPKFQQQQAIWHAQAHSKAAANPRICGVIAWCAFEYTSLINSYHTVKTPGIADIFRVPKLGAAFYRSQRDPSIGPVVYPSFYWDFGAQTPTGPGKHAAIFSNCEKLEVFVGNKHHASLIADTRNYPHLKHAPFFADLEIDGSGHPELRIDGYVSDKLVVSRSFSSDTSRDRFLFEADDSILINDGEDATRAVFKVADAFGNERAFAGGTVTFEVSGPGVLVGDNPFSLAESGGVGAVWIKSSGTGHGRVRVTAKHSTLGKKPVEIICGPAKRELSEAESRGGLT